MIKYAVLLLCVSASALAEVRIGHRATERMFYNDLLLNNRITNGQDASEAEFPHQVTLNFRGEHLCGGVIISERTVVTAAHCVYRRDTSSFEISAGLISLSKPGPNVQKSGVAKIVCHPKYQGTLGPNDIAVMILKNPFKWTKHVQKINLPKKGQEFDGESILSGWGSTSTSMNPVYPDLLQKAKLPIVPFKPCLDYFQTTVDQASNVCTGPVGGNLAACSGDSGGPLIKEVGGSKYVIGLVSWGMIPCGTGGPTVYTKVSNFIDFIEQNAQ